MLAQMPGWVSQEFSTSALRRIAELVIVLVHVLFITLFYILAYIHIQEPSAASRIGRRFFRY